MNEEVEKSIAQHFETFDELKDEWEEDEEEPQPLPNEQERQYAPEEIKGMKQEIHDLREFERLAKSITRNSKGEVLLTALKKGFAETERLGGNKKAIIFTESTRTQEYLKNILEGTEHKGKVVLFNGSNSDPKSREIYQNWLEKYKDTDTITDSKTANMRAAIVDYFKDKAVIMIATEAAAEGINLQFCSLVVNYDLPWNPQRIEQRIGRCHRYGQKFDVVVVNFLNKNNAADQRVYQILAEKFRLFSGVFGASDEVLGSIESGVDFEKRIAQIYQSCRTPEEIQSSFDQLQRELEEHIEDRLKTARQKLLENFDEEVHEKLRISLRESKEYLTRYENWLWQVTRYYLEPYADFVTDEYSFTLRKNPFPEEKIHPGPYQLGRNIEDVNIYRIGHPLAQRIIEQCKSFHAETAQNSQSGLIFNYSDTPTKISILEPLIGKSGWLSVINLTITSFETEDYVIVSGICDDGSFLEEGQCHRLFSLPAQEFSINRGDYGGIIEQLKVSSERRKNEIIDSISLKNTNYFEAELDKLDRWGEDRRNSLRIVLRELDEQIKELKKQSRLAPNLPEKLNHEKEKRQLENKRDEAWKEYDHAAKEIELKKDELIDGIEKKLKQTVSEEKLFTICWKLK